MSITNTIVSLIPRPLKDFPRGYLELTQYAAHMRDGSRRNQDPANDPIGLFSGIFGGGIFTLPPSHRMITSALRIGFAALGVLAVSTLGLSTPVSLAVGAMLSLPSVALVGGSWMLAHGVTALVASLATGSFATLGTGLLLTVGAYIMLEVYDIVPLGLAELFFRKTAEANGAFLANAIMGR